MSSTDERGAVRRVGGALAVAVASIVLLGVTWAIPFVPLAVLVDWGGGALAATGLTLVAGVTGVAFGRPGSALTARVAGYLLAIGAVTVAFLVTTFLVTSFALLVTGILLADVLADVAVQTGVAVALSLGLTCLLAVLGAFRSLDERGAWALTLRMYVALVFMALCAVCFFTATWVAVFVLSLFVVAPGVGVVAAGVATVAGLALVGYLEYRQLLAVERRANATPVGPETFPDLHGRAARVATQLDVPKPTVSVAERATPEAMVVGFRPANTHLVVSTGTLDALDGDQLDAVIAHELAHVANRDATVMTVVSAPVVLAHGVLAWFYGEDERSQSFSPDGAVGDTGLTGEELYGEDGEWAVGQTTTDDGDDDSGPFALLFKPVPLVTRAVGLVVVAMLSRTRETVADRTAAEVTGSPAVLAGALRTIDDRIDTVPDRDLRRVTGVTALSIVPLDRGVLGSTGADTSDGRLARLKRRLLRTHPSTAARLERLEALEDGDG